MFSVKTTDCDTVRTLTVKVITPPAESGQTPAQRAGVVARYLRRLWITHELFNQAVNAAVVALNQAIPKDSENQKRYLGAAQDEGERESLVEFVETLLLTQPASQAVPILYLAMRPSGADNFARTPLEKMNQAAAHNLRKALRVLWPSVRSFKVKPALRAKARKLFIESAIKQSKVGRCLQALDRFSRGWKPFRKILENILQVFNGEEPGSFYLKEIVSQAIQVFKSRRELLNLWNQEHQVWLGEKAAWEENEEHRGYWRLRPQFEAFEASWSYSKRKDPSQAFWSAWLDFLLANGSEFICWREANIHFVDPRSDEVARQRIERAGQARRIRVHLEELSRLNPELSALLALHRQYEKTYVRRLATKRNEDGFKCRPTATEPDAVLHPRFLVLQKKLGWDKLELLATPSRGVSGSVELRMLGIDTVGCESGGCANGTSRGKNTPFERVYFRTSADDFRQIELCTSPDGKTVFYRLPNPLRSKGEPEIGYFAGVRLVYMDRVQEPKTGKVAEQQLKGDASYAVPRAEPYLQFTLKYQAQDSSPNAKEVKFLSVEEKEEKEEEETSATNKKKKFPKRKAPNGLVVCSVQLLPNGDENFARAILCRIRQSEEGNSPPAIDVLRSAVLTLNEIVPDVATGPEAMARMSDRILRKNPTQERDGRALQSNVPALLAKRRARSGKLKGLTLFGLSKLASRISRKQAQSATAGYPKMGRNNNRRLWRHLQESTKKRVELAVRRILGFTCNEEGKTSADGAILPRADGIVIHSISRTNIVHQRNVNRGLMLTAMGKLLLKLESQAAGIGLPLWTVPHAPVSRTCSRCAAMGARYDLVPCSDNSRMEPDFAREGKRFACPNCERREDAYVNAAKSAALTIGSSDWIAQYLHYASIPADQKPAVIGEIRDRIRAQGKL